MLETDNPIMTLVRRLRSFAVPSLGVLISKLDSWEDFADFLRIVREFVPESEQEILRQSAPGAQIAIFADHFERRYFPLQGHLREYAEEYCEVTQYIPVVLMSLDYDDYHNPDYFRPGYQLMTYLLAPPYSGDEGARVAWGEACAQVVPTDLLQRVPQGGFTVDLIMPLVKGTPYEGLALWGQALNWDTGNGFWDISGEEVWGDMPQWERHVVEDLTQEWERAELIENKIKSLAEWLEEDPSKRFHELLDFLESKNGILPRDLQKLAGQLEMDLFNEGGLDSGRTQLPVGFASEPRDPA